MQLNMIEAKAGNAKKTIDVSDVAFGQSYNEALIHQVVTAYLAKGRAGTHKQKTRSEVSGGGIKPWRQKGTGRARAGTIRSPIFRKGGVIFAAKPRDYSQKVNKKSYKAAIRSILSELVRQERLHVIDALELAEPKTKLLQEQLQKLNLENVLIVTDQEDQKLNLAARNLPHVSATLVNQIDPVSLIKHDHVLITEAGLKKLEELVA